MHVYVCALARYALSCCFCCRYHLVGDANDKATKAPVKINTDANIFVTELSKNSSVKLPVRAGRQAYCLVLEGQALVSEPPTPPQQQKTDQPDLPPAAGVAATDDSPAAKVESTCAAPSFAVEQHDAAEIVGPATLTLSSKGGAHILVVEMNWDRRADGRRDM